MSLFNLHLHAFTDAEWNDKIKPALAETGVELKAFAISETDKLVATTKEKFPELVADIQKGIKDAKDPTLSGGDKAVALALDVMATAPDVLKALPDAKDFFVKLVTSVYTDGLVELEKAAGELIAKIL